MFRDVLLLSFLDHSWSPKLEFEYKNFIEHNVLALAIVFKSVCASLVLLYTFIHTQLCVCNCVLMSVCEPFCFMLFMLTNVNIEHMCAQCHCSFYSLGVSPV